jgi:hypothetical protein
MIQRSAILAFVLLFGGLASAASAQQRDSIGRYMMHKTEDGFIRLDTLTGGVSICGASDQGWSCKLAPDEKDRLEAEIDDLEAQVKALEKENLALKDRLDGRNGPPATPDGPTTPDGDRYSYRPDAPAPTRPEFRLPSEEEVDKALDYFENMLRKFQERLKRLERDKPGDGKSNKEL